MKIMTNKTMIYSAKGSPPADHHISDKGVAPENHVQPSALLGNGMKDPKNDGLPRGEVGKVNNNGGKTGRHNDKKTTYHAVKSEKATKREQKKGKTGIWERCQTTSSTRISRRCV